jgi:hypothetical protein
MQLTFQVKDFACCPTLRYRRLAGHSSEQKERLESFYRSSGKIGQGFDLRRPFEFFVLLGQQNV